MSPARTTRLALLFMPLLAFVLAWGLPCHSARLSLVFHGLPLARVVPKEKLDVFQFVKTDSLASRGIVFSKGKAVGWICEPLMASAQYIPFSDHRSFDGFDRFDLRFNLAMLIAWGTRRWWLPLQAVVLLLWLRRRKQRLHHAGKTSGYPFLLH
jgi:hypothetical protein